MTQQSSATSMASHAASKGTCAQAASDHETSAKTSAEVLKARHGLCRFLHVSAGTYTFIVPKSSTAGLQATGSPMVQGCGYGKEACHASVLAVPRSIF